MHFISGALLTAMLLPFIGIMALGVVAMVAVAKEIYDYLHRDIHTPDIFDALATILGGILMTILILLVS